MKKILKNKSKNTRNKVFENFKKQNQEQQGLILLNNIIKKILFRFNENKNKEKWYKVLFLNPKIKLISRKKYRYSIL